MKYVELGFHTEDTDIRRVVLDLAVDTVRILFIAAAGSCRRQR
jgi:hypothetical protein